MVSHIRSENWREVDIVEEEVYQGFINKLKNQLYGLLCEYEKKRNWNNLLDAIEIELIGFPEEHRGINYYILYTKVSSLKYLRYEYFRKTVMECIPLFDRIQQ